MLRELLAAYWKNSVLGSIVSKAEFHLKYCFNNFAKMSFISGLYSSSQEFSRQKYIYYRETQIIQERASKLWCPRKTTWPSSLGSVHPRGRDSEVLPFSKMEPSSPSFRCLDSSWEMPLRRSFASASSDSCPRGVCMCALKVSYTRKQCLFLPAGGSLSTGPQD